MRRAAVILTMLCLVGGQFILGGVAAGANPARFTATPGVITQDTTFTGAKSSSGQIARSDPALLGRTDSTRVNLMIKYDFDTASSYAGRVKGLAATSPRVTGRSLAGNRAAVDAYNAYTSRLATNISTRAQRAVPSLQIHGTYRTAYGGVAASVPANQVSALLRVAGVVAVQQDTLEQPLDDNTQFIGATAVWPSLGGQVNAGTNVIVGVIDTGIWPEHPMMNDPGLPPPPKPLSDYGCEFGDGSDIAHLGQPWHCNNKLIGAYAFTDTYLAVNVTDGQEFCNDATGVCSARDSEGHGTHTASTAAGSQVSSAELYGVQRGPVSGIAPGAHVIMYRVCLTQGCYSSDSVSAVQQAILDGVNVLNFSISGGGSPYTDPVELAFLDATNAGISVNASAGNAGPGAGTADHGGPWTTTVGASTGPRAFSSTLHLTADGGAALDVPGVTLTNGVSSPTPVVMAASLAGEDALCQATLAAGTATGQVVVCSRGGNGRIDKGRRVLAGGAAGMILLNQSAAVTDLESDNHYLPAIQTQFDSNAIANFVTSHTNVRATWAQGTATPATPDVMASFSSRGPTSDWIKPDITAPGVQVLAGTTPQPDQTTADNGPPGNLFMAIAGTSMSSPHAAGVSALVKAAHPSWTPEMIKSALMTSSLQSVVKEDGVTPAGPFDMGSGSIRADRAVNPTLVFDETYAHFVAAGTDTLHRIDLNLASIDATTMPGTITTTRTAMNVSNKGQTLTISTESPAGVSIVVGGKAPGPNGPGAGLAQITIGKNLSKTFWVTIMAPNVPNGQYFGRITLTPQLAGYNPVVIPVAFVKSQGAVTMSHSCDPTSIVVNTGLSHCTLNAANFAQVAAHPTINVTNITPPLGTLHYSNISAPGSALPIPYGGVTWSGTLGPAVPPQVTAINNITGGGPAGGYLPLSAFGITPIAGVGDDTITNFTVPAFFYGGEPYTRVGVVSNGYLVIGGGTGADVSFFPQTFPNAARPNNVIAPFWTDLNPPAGGAIRIGTLTDGASTWLVVDWDAVKNFSNATTHQGEIWIRLASGAAGTGPASEELTISYGAANAGAGDPGSAINWGAENRDGTSGKNIASAPANATEYRPVLTGPTAGGQVTITYDVSSTRVGVFRNQAAMTSDLTPGITQIQVPLNVNYP